MSNGAMRGYTFKSTAGDVDGFSQESFQKAKDALLGRAQKGAVWGTGASLSAMPMVGFGARKQMQKATTGKKRKDRKKRNAPY